MDTYLAIYVHWPFCKSKCPYCDFNSHAAKSIDQARWRTALLCELSHFVNETKNRTVTSLFFGGGTPSLMDPATVAEIIQSIQRLWPVAPDLEITLEANPTSSEAARFAAYRQAGVNRLSLGVQSFDDAALRFLGRAHDAIEAAQAIELAAEHFPRYSFDLIYARPGQTVADWRRELGRALDFAPGHLSVYQLTVEPGTRFAADGVEAADEDTAGDLYEVTQEVLHRAGLPAYEISNHASPGQESRHNLAYWRSWDYLGIGPGAHGRLSRNGITEAVRQIRDPARWLAAVEASGHAVAARTELEPHERAEEILMMGLRTVEGVDLRYLEARTGLGFFKIAGPGAVARMVNGGFLETGDGFVRATPAGRQRLNAVLEQLLA